jgi:adenylate cyclase class IV
MPRNIEIKARVDDLDALAARVAAIATSGPTAIAQDDTFLPCQVGRVIKQRTLYRVGCTRVHLDRVQGLGDFMELEVVLADDEPRRGGIDEAHALMARLGIAPQALVQGAYRDLLNQPGSAGTDTAVNHPESNP